MMQGSSGEGFGSGGAGGKQVHGVASGGLDLQKMDFAKPDKYIREIIEFLNNVTIVTDLSSKTKSRSLSQHDAQLLIYHLLQLFAPNLRAPPTFNAKEIQHLFSTLAYPFVIRSDAITAVGAPSTVAFLMRAIYWLYLIARVYYGRPEAIIEESNEDYDAEGNSKSADDFIS